MRHGKPLATEETLTRHTFSPSATVFSVAPLTLSKRTKQNKERQQKKLTKKPNKQTNKNPPPTENEDSLFQPSFPHSVILAAAWTVAIGTVTVADSSSQPFPGHASIHILAVQPQLLKP